MNSRLSTNAWTPIAIDSHDISAICLSTEAQDFHVYNIYNDGNHSNTINTLRDHLNRQPRNPSKPTALILLGDFNRHHPSWDEARNHHLFTRHNLDDAQILINLLADYGLEMVLPPEIPTLQSFVTGNHTRPDNVFASNTISDLFINCNIAPDKRPTRTDHYPILIEIDITPRRSPETVQRNFRNVDWIEFEETLLEKLQDLGEPQIRSANELRTFVTTLYQATTLVIEKHVPVMKICPWTKRWWTKDLEKERKEVKRLARKAYSTRKQPLDPIHEQYKLARNRYAWHIEQTKHDHWEEYLTDLNESNMWSAHRIVSNEPSDQSRIRIPNLTVKNNAGQEKILTTNGEKCLALFNSFYPSSGPLEHTPDDVEYPPPKFNFKKITEAQVRRAIQRTKPFKAPGRNQIPNVVYKKCENLLVPYLVAIYNATFKYEVCPDEWRESITAALRKVGKGNYKVPNAYRPVELLDTLYKFCASILAEDISMETERLQLLPSNHFGCRPGRTTTDALHLIISFVKNAWRRGDVVSALFLDVKGAFPSVNIDRLVHNMRLRGIPKEYTEWIRRKNGRKTSITFDDFVSQTLNIPDGLAQGCPLSAVCYLFYNAPILEIPTVKNGELGVTWVDDVTLLARGADAEVTNEKLSTIMGKEGGVLEWADTHSCMFAPDKFAVMTFDRRKELIPGQQNKRRPITQPPLLINGKEVERRQEYKLLGVILDRELHWKQQGAKAIAASTNWVKNFRRLAKTTQGVGAKYIHRFYTSIALPRMMYGCSLFLGPGAPNAISTGKKLAQTQQQAAILITGAMRTTATDVLDAHAALLPFQLVIKKFLYRETVRMATLPHTHPTHKVFLRAADRYVKKHRSPLHELTHTFDVHPDQFETIPSFRHTARWRPALKTIVDGSKEDAEENIANADAEFQVFTDGSGVGGGIGAAAVLYRNGEEIDVATFHLGSSDDHTVPEAEMVGLIMGIAMLRTQARGSVKGALIAVDNQGILLGTRTRNRASGCYLQDAIHDEYKRAQNQHSELELEVRWVPAHVGIVGNERIDSEAKSAAKGESSCSKQYLPGKLKSLPRSTTAAKECFQKLLHKEASEMFAKSPCYHRMRSIDPSMPSNQYRRLTAELSHSKQALLRQLRTGHAPLNKHLHRISRSESPLCPKCHQEDETVKHFILTCPRYNRLRDTHFHTLGHGACSLKYLFTSPKALKPLFSFIAATQRLAATFGNFAYEPP